MECSFEVLQHWPHTNCLSSSKRVCPSASRMSDAFQWYMHETWCILVGMNRPAAVLPSSASHGNRKCRPGADIQVHYGRASLAPVTSLPAYFVFGQAPVELEATVGSLGRALQEAEEGGRATGKKAVVVLPDQHYLWAVPSLQKLLGPMEHQVHNHPNHTLVMQPLWSLHCTSVRALYSHCRHLVEGCSRVSAAGLP